MLGLPQTSFARALLFSGASFVIHLGLIGSMPEPKAKADKARFQKVSIQVTEKEKEKKKEKAPEPKPEVPKEKPKPKEEPKAKVSSKPKEKTPDSPPPEPVLGLSKDSFAPDGKSSFAVPAGNTTNVPDEGKRLKPEEIQALEQDLSTDAKLIPDSFQKPAYTPDAEDAGLEGSFAVDVYIDGNGNVTEAELPKKIGYGMDSRLLNAARKSRFHPRKDALGRPIPGWTQIKVRFVPE